MTTNTSALIVFLVNGTALIPLGLLAGAFNIAGNYLGSKSFDKGGSKIVKPVMITVLVVFFIRVIGDLTGIF